MKDVPKKSPEVAILQHFSSEELLQDLQNHTVPVFDILQDPFREDWVIIVMPLLRTVNRPPPASVRELMDFVYQLLEVTP